MRFFLVNQVLTVIILLAHVFMGIYPEWSRYDSEDAWRIGLWVWVATSFILQGISAVLGRMAPPVVNNYTYRTTYPDKAPDADDFRTMRNLRGHE
jgi:hypothetical protein